MRRRARRGGSTSISMAAASSPSSTSWTMPPPSPTMAPAMSTAKRVNRRFRATAAPKAAFMDMATDIDPGRQRMERHRRGRGNNGAHVVVSGCCNAGAGASGSRRKSAAGASLSWSDKRASQWTKVGTQRRRYLSKTSTSFGHPLEGMQLYHHRTILVAQPDASEVPERHAHF